MSVKLPVSTKRALNTDSTNLEFFNITLKPSLFQECSKIVLANNIINDNSLSDLPVSKVKLVTKRLSFQ